MKLFFFLFLWSDKFWQIKFPILDIVLFPYFLYPVNQVAISGSIFMTVAIAWERYVAVHYPIDYNQGTFIDSLGMFYSQLKIELIVKLDPWENCPRFFYYQIGHDKFFDTFS